MGPGDPEIGIWDFSLRFDITPECAKPECPEARVTTVRMPGSPVQPTHSSLAFSDFRHAPTVLRSSCCFRCLGAFFPLRAIFKQNNSFEAITCRFRFNQVQANQRSFHTLLAVLDYFVSAVPQCSYLGTKITKSHFKLSNLELSSLLSPQLLFASVSVLAIC